MFNHIARSMLPLCVFPSLYSNKLFNYQKKIFNSDDAFFQTRTGLERVWVVGPDLG